jgi:hypothetical protein
MKKNLKFLMSLAIIGMAFVSCEPTDEDLINEGKINVTVENGTSYNSKIDSVYAELGYETEDDFGYEVVAKAPYLNGGFSIALPKSLEAKYLSNITEGMPNDLTISDKTAKVSALESFSAYKNGEYVGDFVKTNIDEQAMEDMEMEDYFSLMESGIYTIQYVYVDKPTTISGSFVESDDEVEISSNYNLSLKKGWNTMVSKMSMSITEATGSLEISNSEPEGLKWFFVSGDVVPNPFPVQAKKEANTSMFKNLPKYKHKLFQ